MSNTLWTKSTITEIVDDVWNGSRADLAVRMGITRSHLHSFMRGDLAQEPLLLIERLLAALRPRLNRLGLSLTVGELREAWLRVTLMNDKDPERAEYIRRNAPEFKAAMDYRANARKLAEWFGKNEMHTERAAMLDTIDACSQSVEEAMRLEKEEADETKRS